MMRAMRTVPKVSSVFLLLGLLLGSSACVYRMPIQQGNFLDKKQVDQLEPGMTRSQVAFLLGTPMVPNGFDRDRWDYYYFAQYSRKYAADTYRVTVYFKDEKVDHVDKPPEPVRAAVPPLDVPKGPPVDAGAKPAALPNALIPETPAAPDTPEGQRTKPVPDK
jgi:outer membrane protein assembly factor BamE (lipoprotein component of BamABCDE complex)